MTDITILKNVEEEFDLRLPDEFQVNDGHAAKFKGAFSFTVASPTFTISSSANLALAATFTVGEPTITITGPTLISQDDGVADCYINHAHFRSSELSIQMGCYSIYGQRYKSWLPFTALTIPQGSVINSAVLSLTCSETNMVRWTNSRFGCDNRADAVAPTTRDELNSLTMTANWTAHSTKDWQLNTVYTVDVKSAIQEIINRADWVSGNDLAILIHDNGSSIESTKSFWSADNGSKKPHLDISYI